MNPHFELIQKYLRGEMTPAESIDFESLLESDEALRQEVDFQKKLRQALKDKAGMAFHQQLQQIRNTPAPKKFPWKWLLFPALALIAFLCWWWLSQATQQELLPAKNTPNPVDSQKVSIDTVAAKTPGTPKQQQPVSDPDRRQLLAMADQFYADNLPAQVRNGQKRSSSPTAAALDTIETAFNAGHYPEVIHAVKKLNKGDAQYYYCTRAGAHAAYLSGDYAQCIAFCQNIRALGNGSLQVREAEALELLAYLKWGKTNDPACRKLVKIVLKNQSYPAYKLAIKLN